MENQHPYSYTQSLGKWYSWDTPTGLAIGLVGLTTALGIMLVSIGYFVSLLHQAGLF